MCFIDVRFSERQLLRDRGHCSHWLMESRVLQVQRRMKRLQLSSTQISAVTAAARAAGTCSDLLSCCSFSSKTHRLWQLMQDGDFTLATEPLQKASPLSGIQTSLAGSSSSRDSGGAHQHCFWPTNFSTLPISESCSSPSLHGCSVPAHPSHPTHKSVIKPTILIQASIRGTWLPAPAQTKSYYNRDPDSSLYLQKLLLQRILREITVLCCIH